MSFPDPALGRRAGAVLARRGRLGGQKRRWSGCFSAKGKAEQCSRLFAPPSSDGEQQPRVDQGVHCRRGRRQDCVRSQRRGGAAICPLLVCLLVVSPLCFSLSFRLLAPISRRCAPPTQARRRTRTVQLLSPTKDAHSTGSSRAVVRRKRRLLPCT